MIGFPLGTVGAVAPPSTTFIEEGAEQPTFDEWNLRWSKYDTNTVDSLDTWCRTMHDLRSGDHGIYASKSGYNSHYQTDGGLQPFNANLTGLNSSVSQTEYVLRYDTNQDSVMRKWLDGARYYNTVTFTFWFFSDTGASDAKQPGTETTVGYDFLNAIYYTGGNNSLTKHVAWTDTEAQAYAKSWTQVSVNIPNDATWVGFEFVSGTVAPEGGDPGNAFSAYDIRTVPLGSTGMKEGVFLDDITVVGTDPVEEVPLVTSVANLGTYQTNHTFSVGFADNNPIYAPLKYLFLYYRHDGAASWTKYTTAQNTYGSFATSPIQFVAPTDGEYEFFTQGMDVNNVRENWRGVADMSTTVDTVSPLTDITIIGNGQGGTYTGAAAFSLVGSDVTSGINQTLYRIDGGEWKTYTVNVALTTSGVHTIEYYSKDKAGNSESVKSELVTIANGVNGIVFQDEDKTYPNGNVTIDFTVASTSAINKLEYSLDSGAFVEINKTATSVSLTGLSDGKHSLTVRAVDATNSTIQNVANFTVGQSPSDIGNILSNPLVLGGLAAAAIAVVGGAIWAVKRKKS